MAWGRGICNAIQMNFVTVLTGGTAGSLCLITCWNVAYGHLIRQQLSLVYNHFSEIYKLLEMGIKGTLCRKEQENVLRKTFSVVICTVKGLGIKGIPCLNDQGYCRKRYKEQAKPTDRNIVSVRINACRDISIQQKNKKSQKQLPYGASGRSLAGLRLYGCWGN